MTFILALIRSTPPATPVSLAAINAARAPIVRVIRPYTPSARGL